MTSSRPYLARAIYEWIVDNELTPHIVLDAERQDVNVPDEHIEQGQIVLNVSPHAVREFFIHNDCVEFQASFSGMVQNIYAPIEALIAIYARENGRGMVFSEEDMQDPTIDDETGDSGGDNGGNGGDDHTPQKPPKRGKPNLRIVK